MPKFTVTICEEVTAMIDVEVECKREQDAGRVALAKWVNSGKGDLSESVDERYIYDVKEVKHPATRI